MTVVDFQLNYCFSDFSSINSKNVPFFLFVSLMWEFDDYLFHYFNWTICFIHFLILVLLCSFVVLPEGVKHDLVIQKTETVSTLLLNTSCTGIIIPEKESLLPCVIAKCVWKTPQLRKHISSAMFDNLILITLRAAGRSLLHRLIEPYLKFTGFIFLILSVLTGETTGRKFNFFLVMIVAKQFRGLWGSFLLRTW